MIGEDILHIENLKKYKELKNYKHLCEILEIEPLVGDSKKSQLKDLERYCKYHNQGHKFIIDDIYKTPLSKIENRGKSIGSRGNNKTEYIENIEKLILHILVQNILEGDDKKVGEIFLSKNKLLKLLNMTNKNYGFCKSRTEKLSMFTDISLEEVNDFFECTDSTIVRSLETALNQLRNRSLIFWSKAMTICELVNEVNNNDKIINEFIGSHIDYYGDEVKDYGVKANKVFRKATKEEVSNILLLERIAMDYLGCKSKQDLILEGKWNVFRQTVNEKLVKSNIEFYYDSYEIIANETYINNKIDEFLKFNIPHQDVITHESIINEGVMNKITDNAKKRAKKAKNIDNKDMTKIKLQVRANDKYIDNMTLLVNLMLNRTTKDVRSKVGNLKK